MKQINAEIPQCAYGPLDPKVQTDGDFISGFSTEKRAETDEAEATFYKKLTQPFSVDHLITKAYARFAARDGAKIAVKIYRPKEAAQKLPAVLFIHGGGFITCTVESHDFVPSYIAAHSKVCVISVEYRLAPENKFPMGLEDCYSCLKWMVKEADALNIDGQNISVCGDSSGGNFAAVLCLMAKARAEFSLKSQVLVYPATDFSGLIPKKSLQVYPAIGGLDFMGLYLRPEQSSANPWVSPLLADDLSGLPPALVINAECDPLVDDGLMYAKKLRDAGVQVKSILYQGMPHAFILRTYDETFSALNEICTFLDETLEKA
ncbi:MAG: alpha/beta hydrolase [Anaerolineaceae bacterium]|nr:alpha/beta hydrolase [Anaerolineaceae bacterium]